MNKEKILSYCKSMTKISASDYDTIKAYRADCRERNKQRDKALELLQLFPYDYDFVGSCHRLMITETDIDYCVGQYAPVEVYGALCALLEQIIKERLV